MKRLKQAGYYAFMTAVVALGLLLVASLVPVPGNVEVKIVQSGSMAPTIPVGSTVIIRPTGDYQTGDIITYGPDTPTQVPTTHRIISSTSTDTGVVHTTKGDANDSPDPQPVGEDEIIGEVLFSVPYLGYLLDFARQPVGFALLVGLPAAIIIIDELIVIYREITGAKEASE